MSYDVAQLAPLAVVIPFLSAALNFVIVHRNRLQRTVTIGALAVTLALNVLLVPYGGLLAADLRAGETLLVSGATGNFGGAAVAVALAMGAACVVAPGWRGGVSRTVGVPGAPSPVGRTSGCAGDSAPAAGPRGAGGVGALPSPPDSSNTASTRLPRPVTKCSGPLNLRQLAKMRRTSATNSSVLRYRPTGEFKSGLIGLDAWTLRSTVPRSMGWEMTAG